MIQTRASRTAAAVIQTGRLLVVSNPGFPRVFGAAVFNTVPERRKSLGRRQRQAIPVRTSFLDTFQNCFFPHEPRYVPSEACAFGNTRPGKYRGSSSAKSVTPIRPSRDRLSVPACTRPVARLDRVYDFGS